MLDKFGQSLIKHLRLKSLAKLFVEVMAPQVLECHGKCMKIRSDLFTRAWLRTCYTFKCVKKLFLVRARVHSRSKERLTKPLPCPITNIINVLRVRSYGSVRGGP